MGKVKEMAARNNKKPSAAMARVDGGSERQMRMAAIQAMTARGFDAIAADENIAQIEESGLVDKADLIGVPFAILDAALREGDYGAYVSVTALLKTNEVVVFNDGSTGIRAQLDGLDISPDKPLLVRGGLRASNYEYDDPKTGKKTPATTYYLSGRKPKEEIAGIQKGGAAANGRREARFATV